MSSKYARNVTVMPSERDETDVMLDLRESDRNEGRIPEGSWDPMLMLPRQNPALHAVTRRRRASALRTFIFTIFGVCYVRYRIGA